MPPSSLGWFGAWLIASKAMQTICAINLSTSFSGPLRISRDGSRHSFSG
jgi:hypothetical protein